MKLPEISALIDLATLETSQDHNPPDIQTCSNLLLQHVGNLPLSTVTSNLVPISAALQQLSMFANIHIPEELSLRQVAAALQPAPELLQLAGLTADMQQHLVQLDALAGLVCLMAAGHVDAKLELCFDALALRYRCSSLSLSQLLAALPALKRTAAAAQLMLQQESPQSLAARDSSATAQAEWQERQQLLEAVLTAAFWEADSTGAGVLQPGAQLRQLLFSAAEQLAAIIAGAAPTSAAESAAAAAAATEQWVLGYDRADIAWTSAASDTQQSRVQQDSTLQQRGTQEPGRSSHQNSLQQQQQQQQQPPGSSAAQADVVIMDDAGGCVHFTTSLKEAAAAAAAGRPPRRSSDPLLVLETRQQVNAAEPTSAASFTMQLPEHLKAQQQQLRQHLPMQSRHSAVTNDSSLFYSPMQSDAGSPSSAAMEPLPAGQDSTSAAAAGAETAGYRRSLSGHAARYILSNSAVSKRLLSKLQRVTGEDGMGAAGLDEVQQGQQQQQQQSQAAEVLEAAAVTGPGPTEALTTAASTIARAVQSNVAAASARVLVHCSACFLLTTMVLLGDAALVAGLHAGAGLTLAASFGIAVGANLALVVLLFASLLLVRCLNRSSERAVSEALTGPQVHHLDELLNNISTALALLRQSEQQPGAAQQPAVPRSGGATAGTGTRSLLPRSSSSVAYRDVEAGAAGAHAAAGGVMLSDRLGKMRTLWSTVGRMAGFLQPGEGLGRQESSLSPRAMPSALLMQSTFSAASGEASPRASSSLRHLQVAEQAAGGAGGSSAAGNSVGGGAAGGLRQAATRQVGGGPSDRHAAGAAAAASGYQQSRSGRALGSSGGTGSLPGISVSELYPNV